MSGSTIGSVVGGVIGAYFGGATGARWGMMIGGLVGGYLMPDKFEGPDIGQAQSQTSQAGVPRPWVLGHPAPFAGNLIDGERKARKLEREIQQGGKGGPIQTEEYFLLTYAIRIGEPIGGVIRAWRNGEVVLDYRLIEDIPGYTSDDPNVVQAVKDYYNEAKGKTKKWGQKVRIYLGGEDQMPDSALEAIHGVGNTPYYRGTSLAVVVDDEVAGGVAQNWMWEVTEGANGIPVYPQQVFVGVSSGGSAFYAGDYENTFTPSLAGDAIGNYWLEVNSDSTRMYVGNHNYGLGYVDLETNTYVPFEGASDLGIGGSIGVVKNSLVVAAPILGGAVYTISVATGDVIDSAVLPASAARVIVHGETAYICGYGWPIFMKYVPNSGTVTHYTGEGDGDQYTQGRDMGYSKGNGWFYIPCQRGDDSSPWIVAVDSDGIVQLEIELNATVGWPAGYGAQSIEFEPGGSVMAVSPALGNKVYLMSPDGGVIQYVTVNNTPNKKCKWSNNGGRLYCASGNTIFVFSGPTFDLEDAVVKPEETFFDVAVASRAGVVAIPDVPGTYYDPESGLLVDDDYAENKAAAIAYLRDAEEKVCQRCRVPMGKLDFSALDGITLPGLLVATQDNGLAVLKPLMMAYFHDLPEFDGKIVSVLRGGETVADITDDDVVYTESGEKFEYPQNIEYPAKVSIVTQAPEVDYTPCPQTNIRYAPGIDASSEFSLTVPIPFSGTEALRIAKKLHNVLWARAEAGLNLSLPEKFSGLIKSDCITYDDRRWIVKQTDYADGVMTIKADYDRASNYESDAVAEPTTPPTPPGGGLKGHTIFMVMNLPTLREQDNVAGVYICVQGVLSGWSGADIYMSVDGGLTYDLVLSAILASKMGKLATDITSSSEPITVDLYKSTDTLSNATTAQVALGANAAAIVTDDVAEVIGFESVEQLDNDNWELTTVTRGQKGTLAASHLTGDGFTLLNNAYFLPVSSDLAGQTLYFRPVSKGTSLDASPIYTLVYDPGEIIIDGGGDPL